jgi:4a-hydroxytetrahydrobiopterin dehydratase
MARLSDDEIQKRLQRSPWEREDASIAREFEFDDFTGAMTFVNKVADVAEAADHHPDILLHDYSHVRLTFTNHGEGGLTADDFEMAGKVDGLV